MLSARASRATPMPGDDARAALAADEVDVVGGTAWMWANAKSTGSVDVLFIDEAGQFSLANAIAVSPAAESLVLLGDPQQLDQPLKGSHPVGAERSALAHLLGKDTVVMPEDLGCSWSAPGGCIRISATTPQRCSTRASCCRSPAMSDRL